MEYSDDVVVSEGEKSSFILAPAGTHSAVCYDFWDIGKQKTIFQGKEKVQSKIMIGWEIDETIPSGEYEGKRFTVFKRYTKSLNEKSALRADLESWRGKKFTEQELQGFSLKNLIGVNALVTLIHNESGGKTYVNVNSVVKPPKNAPALKPENKRSVPDWIVKLRDKAVPESQNDPVNPHFVEEDFDEAPEQEEEIPF